MNIHVPKKTELFSEEYNGKDMLHTERRGTKACWIKGETFWGKQLHKGCLRQRAVSWIQKEISVAGAESDVDRALGNEVRT